MADPFWKLCWKMDLEGVRLALQSEHIDVNSQDQDGSDISPSNIKRLGFRSSNPEVMADPFWKLCWKMDLEGVRLALQSEDTDVNSQDQDGNIVSPSKIRF